MADPIDIPSNTAAALLAESVESATQTARNSRDNASLLMNTLGAGTVMMQNLLGSTVVGRTVSGINGTELAGPTNPAPAAKQ